VKSRKAYLIVEGQGELGAAHNLVVRLWADLGLPANVVWTHPKRGTGLNTQAGVLKACELLRSERDCSQALLLRDEDDGCPATLGPTVAGWVAAASLPFPVSVVLAHREYEAWFLPCLPAMAGKEIRPGLHLLSDVTFAGNPEGKRGVKEWLTTNLYPAGKAYKPTLDQLPLTRLVEFERLRASAVPSFGTLENGLRFLAAPGDAKVYPPPMHGASASADPTPGGARKRADGPRSSEGKSKDRASRRRGG
jgi:hypothetical protein